jgi:hypothetical protein
MKSICFLTSSPTHISEFNISPNAHFIYNFSSTQLLSANCSGCSNQPTFSQLQPFTDFSNALYPITGNPNLKPEYNSSFSLRYIKFNSVSGNVLFSNFNFAQTNNKIVSNTIYYPANYKLNSKFASTVATLYLNADGYYSASAFYVFAKPWEKRKYNLFFRGNLANNKNSSYITNVKSTNFFFITGKNTAKTVVASKGIRFMVDISNIINAELNTTYTINSSKNSITQRGINDNFRNWALGRNVKNYVWKDWTLSYDYSKIFYYGYKGAKKTNILNTYLERRFLKTKTATLRLSAIDLFNKNRGYTSTQNGSFITLTNTDRLGRYHLLSLTYRLQKIAGKKSIMGPGGPGDDGPTRGGGQSIDYHRACNLLTDYEI